MAEGVSWLGLAIGNSRLHWAWFIGTRLQKAWDTEHLAPAAVEQAIQELVQGKCGDDIQINPQPLLYVASVVPAQTGLWEAYPNVRLITLEQLPLQGLYPTMGIDRALAVLGAGSKFGFPVLSIDAGTALTLTGVNCDRQIVGGAILPGLRLQLQSLAQKTAALPPVELPSQLPSRWGLNTPEAIQSGVLYTVLAGIQDFIEAWWREFPESPIVLTGGDCDRLFTYLQAQFSDTAKLIAAPYSIFWGMQFLANFEA